jgi:hypothetical protein
MQRRKTRRWIDALGIKVPVGEIVFRLDEVSIKLFLITSKLIHYSSL